MPPPDDDVVVTIPQGAVLTFTTPTRDYTATIRGPGNLSKQVYQDEELPNKPTGDYTLSVYDRQLRSLTVTLTGSLATPQTLSRTQQTRVVMSYRVT